jgi:glyoxylase I family protein
MTVRITQLLHAALLVQDLEKARHFYGEVLGLIECHRPLDFPGSWYQLEFRQNQFHRLVWALTKV